MNFSRIKKVCVGVQLYLSLEITFFSFVILYKSNESLLHVVMVRISRGVNTKIYWQQTARTGLLFVFPLLMCISITIIIAFSKSWLHVLHPRDKALFIAQCCYFSADSVTYKNFNKSNYILWPLYSFLDPLIRVFSSAMFEKILHF